MSIMKNLLILTCTLLCMYTAQARFPTQEESINVISHYPKQLQELGVYIDSTLDAVQSISDMEYFCSTQGMLAFNIMKMRQKGVDYSDVYHLMNISNTADLTIKGMTKLESYKGIFEEAYDYPIYQNKEDKGTATTFYMNYKNHQCLFSL